MERARDLSEGTRSGEGVGAWKNFWPGTAATPPPHPPPRSARPDLDPTAIPRLRRLQIEPCPIRRSTGYCGFVDKYDNRA